MRGWSFPVGRVLGVEVRMHTFFLVLLGFSISYGISMSNSGGRGFLLWAILLLAVLVREGARAIAAVFFGLELKSLLLLPTGGLPTYSVSEAEQGNGVQQWMALVGPIANIVFGLVTGALLLTVAPELNLYARPWVTPGHLLKAFVWINLLLGVVNFLPAVPLDGGRRIRNGLDQAARTVTRTKQLASIGQVVAIGLVLAGVLTGSIVLIVFGFFVLIGAHMEDQGLILQTEVDTVTMRDVMLTDYTTLSASDTLEDALERAVHSLQDVFPVVRGGFIVGAVSRQSIAEALSAGGNSYVQGVMSRTFEVAKPDDALVNTLKRISGVGTTQFVPVLEGDRVVGIVTPHHLSQSIRLRGLLTRRGDGRAGRDERS
jgi:Zn-dependent protease/CBS domain-containing protein